VAAKPSLKFYHKQSGPRVPLVAPSILHFIQ